MYNICLSSFKMRQLLALDNNGKWKTDYGPAGGSNFRFVMCSGQATMNIIPDRQAPDEKLPRENTKRRVGVNYYDIFHIAHLH